MITQCTDSNEAIHMSHARSEYKEFKALAPDAFEIVSVLGQQRTWLRGIGRSATCQKLTGGFARSSTGLAAACSAALI